MEHRDFGGMNAASFGPGSAFSLFCNPQRRKTTLPVTKMFKPSVFARRLRRDTCQEPKSTISGQTLISKTFFGPGGVFVDLDADIISKIIYI